MRGTSTREINCPRESCEHSIEITVKWYSDPGRMYLPNGDPGWPPEWGIDEHTQLPDACPAGHEWTPDELAEMELRLERLIENFDTTEDGFHEDDGGYGDWVYEQMKDRKLNEEHP